MRTGPCHSVEMPFMHLVINVIFLRRILDCLLPKYFQWSRNYPELQSWNIGMHSLNQSAYSIQLAGKIGLWWAHNQSHAYQDECDQILRLLFELFHLSLKPERMWGLALLLPFYLHVEFIRRLSPKMEEGESWWHNLGPKSCRVEFSTTMEFLLK